MGENCPTDSSQSQTRPSACLWEHSRSQASRADAALDSVLCQLDQEAGFPPGVVNIINGQGKVAGAAIAQHSDVDKIAFTGSTATGKEVMKQASGTMKSITLETGGKSPLLVFEDAALDQAVKWSHLGIMSNMGQICSAVSSCDTHNTTSGVSNSLNFT